MHLAFKLLLSESDNKLKNRTISVHLSSTVNKLGVLLISILANGSQSSAVLSILLSASFMIYEFYEDSKALLVVNCFCSENRQQTLVLVKIMNCNNK